MPVDVQIQPLLDTVDLFGAPDAISAYSLSGHIAISLLPSRSFFEPTRQKYTLESLELTFEGQSELVSDVTGYSAIRLCNIKREMVHQEPIELTNEIDGSGHPQPSRWEFVFDVPVPGWLPASFPFRESHHGCQVGTQYTLQVTARLKDASRDESGGSASSMFCGLFRPPFFTRTARCPIELKRFFMRPTLLLEDAQASTSSVFPSIPYAITTSVQRSSSNQLKAPRTIPMEILKAIEVMAEVPERLALDQNRLPFTMRLRPGKEFPTDALSRTRIVGFNMDVRQHESYSSLPRPSYLRRFPVSPKSQQPPKVPLLSPHPLREVYELGIAVAPNSPVNGPGIQYDVDFSLVPSHSTQSSYRVANGGLYLEKGGTMSFNIALNLKDDLAREGHQTEISSSSKEDRWKCVRTTIDTPFLTVRHQLLMELICQYQDDTDENDDPDSSPIAQELLRFSIPLHFVIPAAPFINPFSVSSSSSSSSAVSLNTPPQQSPADAQRSPYGKHASMKIPAYSQLFYSNGDPRFDDWDLHGEALPVYCKDEEDAGDNGNSTHPTSTT